MPNAVITIPQPVLTSGQFFKVRYRQVPFGSWSGYTNRNNNPFTLTGLSANQYELEIVLVKPDGTECPAVYKTFTITGEYDCAKVTFAAQMVKVGSVYNLVVQYTKNAGYTDPPCGWRIVYTQNSTTNTYTVASLSGSTGSFKIPLLNNNGVLVRVYSDMCSDKIKMCYESDVSKPTEPCTGMTLVNAVMTKNVSTNTFYITLNVTQSTPPTTAPMVYYKQTNAVNTGKADELLFNPAISATATTIVFKVSPNNNVNSEVYLYTGYLRDACGNIFYYNVSCNRF